MGGFGLLQTLPWLPLLVLAALCSAVAIIDARTQRIPNVLNVAVVFLGIANAAIYQTPTLADGVMAGLVGFGLLWSVRAGYRRWRGFHGLGLGDVKFGGAIGPWVGLEGWPIMLLVAALAGLVWVGLSMAWGQRVTATSRLPFGPFMALGSLTSWVVVHCF